MTTTSTTTEKVALRRTLVGKVVSDKMQKTVTVLVERRVKHPLYGKVMIRSKKYHADTGVDTFGMGDTVEIQECRPISKTKSWKVSKLIEAAK
jgi:small subunit ribosomal protein S17